MTLALTNMSRRPKMQGRPKARSTQCYFAPSFRNTRDTELEVGNAKSTGVLVQRFKQKWGVGIRVVVFSTKSKDTTE